MAPVASSSHAAHGHMSLKARARAEFVRFLVLFVYLWLIFSLFQIHEYLVLAKLNLPFFKLGAALVNALVFAKIMLLADKVRIGDWFAGRPLIVPILMRAIGLAAMFIVAHLLEEGVEAWWHGESLAARLPDHGGGPPGLAATAALIAVSLIPFLAFEEMELALGPGTLRGLLLARRQQAR
jgi:hypothetical protein